MRWQCVSLTWPPGSRRAGRQQRRRRSHREAAKGAWGRRDRAVMRLRAWRGQWPRINCNQYRKWNSSTRQGKKTREGEEVGSKGNLPQLFKHRIFWTELRFVSTLTAFLFYTRRHAPEGRRVEIMIILTFTPTDERRLDHMAAWVSVNNFCPRRRAGARSVETEADRPRVCVYVRACVCVCLCVRERKRWRDLIQTKALARRQMSLSRTHTYMYMSALTVCRLKM